MKLKLICLCLLLCALVLPAAAQNVYCSAPAPGYNAPGWSTTSGNYGFQSVPTGGSYLETYFGNCLGDLITTSASSSGNEFYAVAPIVTSGMGQTTGNNVFTNFSVKYQSDNAEVNHDDGSGVDTCSSIPTILQQGLACSTLYNEPATGGTGSYLAGCVGTGSSLFPGRHITGTFGGAPYNELLLIEKDPGLNPVLIAAAEVSPLTIGSYYWIGLKHRSSGNSSAVLLDSSGATVATAAGYPSSSLPVNQLDPTGFLFFGGNNPQCGVYGTTHNITIVDSSIYN